MRPRVLFRIMVSTYVRTYVSKKATSVARRGLVDCMLYIEY